MFEVLILISLDGARREETKRNESSEKCSPKAIRVYIYFHHRQFDNFKG